MPVPAPTARIEASFQPILPKVDHILELMREHQARMTGGGKGAEGDVDLEDKIIKEVRWAVMGFHLVIGIMVTGREIGADYDFESHAPFLLSLAPNIPPVSEPERITSNAKHQTRYAINNNDITTTTTGIGNKDSPRRPKASGTRSSRWPS
jgi:hypothetical protein